MPSQSCPSCGSVLPVDPRFVTWCDSCDWNLKPEDRPAQAGRLDWAASALGRRLGDRMADRLAETDQLAPRLTPAKLAAYGIAALVHAFVLGLVVLGVWLVVEEGLFLKIGGALLLGLAFLMRPRLGTRPKNGVITRAEAPTLYAFVDEIAASLRTASAHTIAITSDFNASWAVVGIRRQRVLTLGLPLLSVLEPQEQTAVIAHELAHGRNGDSTRGLFVGSAIDGLAELYATLVPPRQYDGVEALGPAELAARPVLWLIGQPFRLLLMLELALLLQDSKRAEYLADQLAAETAGTAAEIGFQEKLLLGGSIGMAVHQHVVGRTPSRGDVFDALRQAVDNVPRRELERRRRVARLEGARLGAAHPPTAKRIEVLERRPTAAAAVVLDPRRRAAIDGEIAAVRAALSRQIVEQYRADLAAW